MKLRSLQRPGLRWTLTALTVAFAALWLGSGKLRLIWSPTSQTQIALVAGALRFERAPTIQPGSTQGLRAVRSQQAFSIQWDPWTSRPWQTWKLYFVALWPLVALLLAATLACWWVRFRDHPPQWRRIKLRSALLKSIKWTSTAACAFLLLATGLSFKRAVCYLGGNSTLDIFQVDFERGGASATWGQRVFSAGPDPKRGWYVVAPGQYPLSGSLKLIPSWKCDKRFLYEGITTLTIPFWTPAAVLGLLPMMMFSSAYRARRAGASTCPTCHYPRTGLPPTSPCPECGTTPKPITSPT